MALTAAAQTGVSLGTFAWALGWRDVAAARTMAFTTLIFGELFRSFASRSARRTFWEVGPLTNVPLVAVVASSRALLCGLVPVTIIELAKLARRRT